MNDDNVIIISDLNDDVSDDVSNYNTASIVFNTALLTTEYMLDFNNVEDAVSF